MMSLDPETDSKPIIIIILSKYDSPPVSQPKMCAQPSVALAGPVARSDYAGGVTNRRKIEMKL